MAEVARRLRRTYGPAHPRLPRDPLELLIQTILSQHTSDRNRDRAYAQLRRSFPTWEKLMEAPVEAVAEAVRGAGLHRQRAERIQAVLRRIHNERQNLDLTFLEELPLPMAEEFLLSLPGVGKKTASVVLLFAFAKPLFPVDTHIQRVTRRLGLLNNKDEPHEALRPWVPRGRELELHLHLIRLGREVCRPRHPRCSSCPVLDLCPFGQHAQGE